MINFQHITPEHKQIYAPLLAVGGERGCEYSFANLCLWGRQRAAVVCGHMVLFSQFNRKSVYPYPVGQGDKKAVLDAIVADAKERGIPCRITGLTAEDRQTLESCYPGQFRFHCDRDSYDYVYDISDLADLKGRKFQKKRNHCNRFWEHFEHCEVRPLCPENLEVAEQFVQQWYDLRAQTDPHGDYHMERAALMKALKHYRQLDMEGLLLVQGEDVLALSMGSPMSGDTFDVHFEKAHPDAEGAYAAINCEFARYIRKKYPEVKFLNREDDLGLEGLRKAKLSYCPHHMVEKCWACLLEDAYDY